MAIVRDLVVTSAAGVYAHNCSADASVILMHATEWEGDATCTHPTAVSYAGAPGTRLEQTESGSGGAREVCGDLYFLTNPTAGANNVAWVGGANLICISVSYEGTNIDNPIDNSCSSTDTIALLTGKGCAVTYVEGGLGCGFANRDTAATILWANPIGYTFLAERTVGVAGGCGAASVEGPSPMDSPETYKGVSAGTTLMAGCIAVAMNPEPPSRGRAIKYFYNFWDADPKVRDESGREIPPNEIRPDNWIEAEGIALPTVEGYISFIENPSRSKIVEVNADDRSASIKTSKNQFAAVLIERAAAGRG